MLFVDSCIPVRQWADICNTRCSILSRFSHFHVSHFPPQQHGAAFSCPAISASPLRVVAFAQQTMNATDWELETSTTRSAPALPTSRFFREIGLVFAMTCGLISPLRLSLHLATLSASRHVKKYRFNRLATNAGPNDVLLSMSALEIGL